MHSTSPVQRLLQSVRLYQLPSEPFQGRHMPSSAFGSLAHVAGLKDRSTGRRLAFLAVLGRPVCSDPGSWDRVCALLDPASCSSPF